MNTGDFARKAYKIGDMYQGYEQRSKIAEVAMNFRVCYAKQHYMSDYLCTQTPQCDRQEVKAELA